MMVEGRRLVIVPLAVGWHLTDGGGAGRTFLTRGEAVREGRALADQWSGPVRLLVWDGDVATTVYERGGEGTPIVR